MTDHTKCLKRLKTMKCESYVKSVKKIRMIVRHLPPDISMRECHELFGGCAGMRLLYLSCARHKRNYFNYCTLYLLFDSHESAYSFQNKFDKLKLFSRDNKEFTIIVEMASFQTPNIFGGFDAARSTNRIRGDCINPIASNTISTNPIVCNFKDNNPNVNNKFDTNPIVCNSICVNPNVNNIIDNINSISKQTQCDPIVLSTCQTNINSMSRQSIVSNTIDTQSLFNSFSNTCQITDNSIVNDSIITNPNCKQSIVVNAKDNRSLSDSITTTCHNTNPIVNKSIVSNPKDKQTIVSHNKTNKSLSNTNISITCRSVNPIVSNSIVNSKDKQSIVNNSIDKQTSFISIISNTVKNTKPIKSSNPNSIVNNSIVDNPVDQPIVFNSLQSPHKFIDNSVSPQSPLINSNIFKDFLSLINNDKYINENNIDIDKDEESRPLLAQTLLESEDFRNTIRACAKSMNKRTVVTVKTKTRKKNNGGTKKAAIVINDKEFPSL